MIAPAVRSLWGPVDFAGSEESEGGNAVCATMPLTAVSRNPIPITGERIAAVKVIKQLETTWLRLSAGAISLRIRFEEVPKSLQEMGGQSLGRSLTAKGYLPPVVPILAGRIFTRDRFRPTRPRRSDNGR